MNINDQPKLKSGNGSTIKTLAIYGIVGFLVACIGWFIQTRLSSSHNIAVLNQRNLTNASSVERWSIVDGEIQNVRVGQRVPAVNPDINDISEDIRGNIDPRFHRVIKVRCANHEGLQTDITLLRSIDWIKDAIRNAEQHYNSSNLDQVVGKRIRLVVAELHIDSHAKILAIEPCPVVADGPGEIVTATYVTNEAPVWKLVFEPVRGPPKYESTSESKNELDSIELTITYGHPIWSVDRSAFVDAGQLKIGERCIAIDEALYQLTSKTQKVADEPVYNFEVANHHVYYVSRFGLLVHNGKSKSQDGPIDCTGKSKTKTSQQKANSGPSPKTAGRGAKQTANAGKSRAPARLPLFSRKHGGDAHDSAINEKIKNLPNTVSDVRKHQAQLDRFGNKVSNGKPDLQWTDENGIRHILEVVATNRNTHEAARRAADPDAIIHILNLFNRK